MKTIKKLAYNKNKIIIICIGKLLDNIEEFVMKNIVVGVKKCDIKVIWLMNNIIENVVIIQ